MKKLPAIISVMLALATMVSCGSHRRVTLSNTIQPKGSLVPVGIYYDNGRQALNQKGDSLGDDDLSSYQHAMLYKGKSEWRRPTTWGNIDFIDADGNRWTNESLRGRITVLNFWSKLCGPCLREIPWLCSLRDSFPEVNFIGVSLSDEESVKDVVKKRNFNWPQIVADSTLTRWLPRESYFPTTVVIDQNGYVRTFNVGGRKIDQRRVEDTLRAVINYGPLTSPRNYKDLHYEEEYFNP